ncbi:uncharacterized protein VICG_01839 [Vittaforma corneae ATCC 50505]|uniref:Uncharacterized protein n=1 Tax=Vittaforma corneae (strain ATCC 50505) TaxID=993615 RepID=L2GKY5_VITCO|nr:uncharacterized protein VICG_01839 [Vittaforma corneae ATCC 50505]ELA41140.1 hypothetical protein VICG_01839 [Vittaforma corneae ATCC 50505]
MIKGKVFKTQLQSKKYLTTEAITHIAFFVIRLGLFAISRAVNFHLKITPKRRIEAVNDFITNLIFSLFLLFFILHSLFIENIYGYCLSVLLMLHNFVFMLVMILMSRFGVQIKVKLWSVGLVISLSYIVEMCATIFYIYKKRAENSRALFQTIGADPKINDMFSTRKKLQTLGTINLFIPVIIIKKLYFIPSQFELKIEWINIVVLALTVLQQLFVYAKFHNEDLVQRRIAIAVTIVKLAINIVLIVTTSIEFIYLLRRAKDVRIIIYVELLLITLVFLYYLWIDMKNFGKGLKEHILFRTRGLTL